MFSFKRMFAVAKKETVELFRDPMRVTANFIVPIVIMFIFSSGMNLDIEHLPFVVLDFDNSTQSRQYVDSYINSDYYDYLGNVNSSDEAEKLLKQGKAKFYIDIPADFGRKLLSGKGSQIGVFIDGTLPFRAESVKGYIAGTNAVYLYSKLMENYGITSDITEYRIKSRYWYNQASESKFSFVPGVLVIILMSIPAIMMTLSIVGEKEVGTITNFYATPLTKLEFLLGKQIIYVLIFFIIYLILIGIAVFFYQVPIKGNFLLLTLMAILYIFSTTAIGLLVSSFVKTQIAGLLIAAIMTMIPAFTYSGLLVPISSLDKAGQFMSLLYPVSYFMHTTIGIFTKDLPVSSILPNFIWIGLFYAVVMGGCVMLLKKQEK
ncbi:MAG TPA: ABC transporter permease [Rickettsiales bacterium]|nr:ABC transporter permease [Rickettsiales bacterium]